MKRRTLASLLALSVGLTPVAPVHAQDLDRAVGALIGAIIGGAIQEQQRQRQQTTRQPQRAQPAHPAVSQAQRQQTRDVQTALNFFGFPAGAVDGAMGPNTRNAIRAYQQAMGFPVTGTLDATQRDFLIGSYHRARHAGAIPRDSSILQQQGPQGLLRIYRDEMRGIAAPTDQPQANAPIQFGQADALGASQPQIGAGSVGTPGLAASSVGEGALLGPHAVIDPELDTYRCLGAASLASFAECLRAAGVSDPAVRAAVALSRDGANQYVIDYSALGPVDVAMLQWPAAGAGTTEGFVIEGAQFLAAGDLFRPMDIRDGPSRAIARRYPRATHMNPASVAGHRYLPDGGQRFVLVTPLTDGCRACDVVATAIGFVDFRDGRVVDSGTIGWAPERGEQFAGSNADRAEMRRLMLAEVRRLILSGDTREIQTQLNLRGYIAGAMDGAFGPNTARALRDFRREHCLGDDAEWTQQTADRLAGLAGMERPFGETAECGPRPTWSVARAASFAAADIPRQMTNTLPFEDGVYAVESRYCDPETQASLGDAFGVSIQVIEGKHITRGYEASCEISSVAELGTRLEITAGCMAEGYREMREWSVEAISSTAFIEHGGFLDGVRFDLCMSPIVNSTEIHESGKLSRTAEMRTGQVEIAPKGALTLQWEFLDPAYAQTNGGQLLGLDLRAEPGTPVLAPTSGMIMGNRTGANVPAEEKWLILRDTASGQEHVFGHLVSPLHPGDEIHAGEPLGQIAAGSGGQRLHWGLNRFGVWQAVDTAAGWGWGHGPEGADAEQVRARGWIDPREQFQLSITPAPTLPPAPKALDPESPPTETFDTLSLIEEHFTSALGVDSDYVQLQLIDAGFYSGDLAPLDSGGRHSQWTPQVQSAFEAAVEYARTQGISFELYNESGYYAFVEAVRAHRLRD